MELEPGKIDEARVYQVALSASAITEDMTTPVDPTTAFQVGFKTPANGAAGVRTTPVTAGFTRDVNPRVSAAGWQIYDSYLKANRIESGAASYAEVVRLVLGVRLHDRPVLTP